MKINIALASDNNYAPYTAATIVSIIKNNTSNSDISFYYLCPPGFSISNKEKILGLAKNHRNISITFINMNDAFKNIKSEIKHLTIQTYYRLLLADIINVDKCFYFDSDVIVECDLSELFKINLNKYYIAGVKAAGYHHRDGNPNYCNLIGIREISQYINAGVVLLNLKNIRRYRVTDKFIILCNKKLPSDQDIINIVCFNKILFLNFSYNAMSKYFGPEQRYVDDAVRIFGKKEYLEAKTNPKIIHYAGEEKPWQKRGVFKNDNFWHYLKETPFNFHIKIKYYQNTILNIFHKNK